MYVLLIIIGVILIGLNIKAIKKDQNSFNRAMIEAETEVDEVDMKILKMRSEFSKTITELQREISNLKEDYNIEEKENEKINDESINIMSETKYNSINVELSEHKDNLDKKESFSENLEESDYEYINTLVKTINSIEDNVLIKSKESVKLSKINVDEVKTDESPDKNVINENKDHNPEITTRPNSLKVEDVKKLLGQGLSDEVIAQNLNIGKGEVLLIKELYLK